MPQTKAQRSAAARKAAATRKRHAAERKAHEEGKEGKEQARAVVDRTSELSDEVLKSLESGQRAAIEAVRKFVVTVDEALPALGGHPSRRQGIVDATLEMAERLVHTQYDFLRHVVQNAGKGLAVRATTSSAPGGSWGAAAMRS